MTNPITSMTRRLRPHRPSPIRRCPVCRAPVLDGAPAVYVRGLHVHKECATYRMRRRTRKGGG